MSPPEDRPGGVGDDATRLALLVAVCLVLFFFRLGAEPLWDHDEGMHAATSKRMVTSGDWVVPTHNGVPFYDKPPLYNWLVAVSFVALGFNEFAARLPSAVLGTACVLATYLLGRRMFGEWGGFLGGIALATSLYFVVLSRVVVHDMTLALCVTASLGLFYTGYTDERARKLCWRLFYPVLGLGVLAKGLLGVVLPALPIAAFLVARRDLRFVGRMRLGPGLVACVAIAGPWYAAMALRAPGYLYEFFVGVHLQRFLHGMPLNPRPWHFYLPVLVGGVLPWTFLAGLALWRAARAPRGPQHPALLLLLLWFATGLTFFSVSGVKVASYLLPLFPPLALLVGWLLTETWTSSTRPRDRSVIAAHAAAFALTAAGALYLWVRPPQRAIERYGLDPSVGAAIAGCAAAAALIGLVALVCRRRRVVVAAFVLQSVVWVWGAQLFVVPAVSPYRNTKHLALALDAVLPPGEDLVFYHRVHDSSLFYTDRHARSLTGPELATYFAAERRVFLVISRDDLGVLAPLGGAVHQVAAEGASCVISNRAGALARR